MEASSASGQDHGNAGRIELVSFKEITAESRHICDLYDLYAVSLAGQSLKAAEA